MSDPTPASVQPAPKRRRLLKATIVVVLALGVFVWFLPSMLSSTWMRPTVLSWMNRDPAHRVDFAELDLSWTGGMKLKDFTVHDASGAPFVSAKSVALDLQWKPLFDKRIVVDEFTVKDAVVDLSRPSPPEAAGAKPPELPEGTFGLSSARVPVSLRDVVVKFEKGSLRIDSADLLVKVEDGALVVDPIDADVNGGKVTGTAFVALGSPAGHALDLHAKGVVLDEFLAPVGARVFPLLAGDPKDGKTTGKADAELKFTASGRRVPEIKQSLRGDGSTTLSDVALDAKSWLTEALRAVGGGADRMRLEPVKMTFHVADGRVLIDDTDAKSADLLMRTGGTVTLEGEMDVRLGVKPAARVAAFERYARFLDPSGFVPIRMTGTVTSPKTSLPGVGDILENALKDEGVADKAKKALEGLLGGKDDAPAKKTPPKK